LFIRLVAPRYRRWQWYGDSNLCLPLFLGYCSHPLRLSGVSSQAVVDAICTYGLVQTDGVSITGMLFLRGGASGVAPKTNLNEVPKCDPCIDFGVRP
jgi:hypothetical protein